MEVGKKEPSVKSQCPENDAIVELVFEGVDGIFEEDVACINVVGDILLKQRRQILLERVDHLLDFWSGRQPGRLF